METQRTAASPVVDTTSATTFDTQVKDSHSQSAPLPPAESWIHKIPHGPRTQAVAFVLAAIATAAAASAGAKSSEPSLPPPTGGMIDTDGFHGQLPAGLDLETVTNELQHNYKPVTVQGPSGETTIFVTKHPLGSTPQK
jgi:hypothetical protein